LLLLLSFFFFIMPRPPISTLFPYTTLFRSALSRWGQWSTAVNWVDVHVGDFTGDKKDDIAGRVQPTGKWWVASSLGNSFNNTVRSEEHTSELQSPCNLVCRLLLEKKKKKTI